MERTAVEDPERGAGSGQHEITGGAERGASLVEYVLLVAMIALVVVGAAALLGGATGAQLSSAAALFPD